MTDRGSKDWSSPSSVSSRSSRPPAAPDPVGGVGVAPPAAPNCPVVRVEGAIVRSYSNITGLNPFLNKHAAAGAVQRGLCRSAGLPTPGACGKRSWGKPRRFVPARFLVTSRQGSLILLLKPFLPNPLPPPCDGVIISRRAGSVFSWSSSSIPCRPRLYSRV